MSSFPKMSKARLDDDAYQQLRQQVLERDGWRCQHCGGMTNLEVHHAQFRSQQGSDSEDNLITLCAHCHKLIHAKHQAGAALKLKRPQKMAGDVTSHRN